MHTRRAIRRAQSPQFAVAFFAMAGSTQALAVFPVPFIPTTGYRLDMIQFDGSGHQSALLAMGAQGLLG